MTITSSIRVSGRVRGVGFRYVAFNLASEYGITGYVENDRDSRDVILHCQGDGDKIQDFMDKISRMNGLIRVDKVSVDRIDDEKYDNFTIR